MQDLQDLFWGDVTCQNETMWGSAGMSARRNVAEKKKKLAGDEFKATVMSFSFCWENLSIWWVSWMTERDRLWMETDILLAAHDVKQGSGGKSLDLSCCAGAVQNAVCLNLNIGFCDTDTAEGCNMLMSPLKTHQKKAECVLSASYIPDELLWVFWWVKGCSDNCE